MHQSLRVAAAGTILFGHAFNLRLKTTSMVGFGCTVGRARTEADGPGPPTGAKEGTKMVQLVRWLVASGVGAEVVKGSSRLMSHRPDRQLMGTALVLLLVGWVVSVGDLLVPLLALAPLGLLLFLTAGFVSIGTCVAAAVVAGNLILRRVRSTGAATAGYAGHGLLGAGLLLLAAASLVAERVVGLVAAIHG